MTGQGLARVAWICVAFLVIAGFFVITEQRAPNFGWLVYLLLLACPVIHMLSHGRHRRSRGGGGPEHGTHPASSPDQGRARHDY